MKYLALAILAALLLAPIVGCEAHGKVGDDDTHLDVHTK